TNLLCTGANPSRCGLARQPVAILVTICGSRRKETLIKFVFSQSLLTSAATLKVVKTVKALDRSGESVYKIVKCLLDDSSLINGARHPASGHGRVLCGHRAAG